MNLCDWMSLLEVTEKTERRRFYAERSFLFHDVVSFRTYFYSDTSTMEAESQRVLEYLTEVEEAAEDVLTSKQQVATHVVTTRY